jgi:hypothetical protein
MGLAYMLDESDPFYQPFVTEHKGIKLPEVWAKVAGSDDYEVSTYGNVRSRKYGNWRQLKAMVDKPVNKLDGKKTEDIRRWHLYVQPRIGGEYAHIYIHRLVLETFVGPCPDGKECLHNNGYGTDNRLINLRWGTREENVADRDKQGRTVKGVDHFRHKLTEDDVREIRKLSASGHTSIEIAPLYGISPRSIRKVVSKTRWKHIAD